MKRQMVRKISVSAMLLGMGLILPVFTGQIPQIGNMLLPMHIPVLICGLVCGWQYGFLVGLIMPLLRHMIFGMPVLFPVGIAMTFELAAYGMMAGWLYAHSEERSISVLYRSLLISMLTGRIVWAVVRMLLSGVSETGFTWSLFVAEAFVNAIPGIIIQLTLIPAIMVALNRTGLLPEAER